MENRTSTNRWVAKIGHNELKKQTNKRMQFWVEPETNVDLGRVEGRRELNVIKHVWNSERRHTFLNMKIKTIPFQNPGTEMNTYGPRTREVEIRGSGAGWCARLMKLVSSWFSWWELAHQDLEQPRWRSKPGGLSHKLNPHRRMRTDLQSHPLSSICVPWHTCDLPYHTFTR